MVEQFNAAMDERHGERRGVTIERPATVADWQQLPAQWQDPSGELQPADLRKYQAARKKCAEAAEKLDTANLELAHLENLARWLQPIAAACQPDVVNGLADELRQSQQTGMSSCRLEVSST